MTGVSEKELIKVLETKYSIPLSVVTVMGAEFHFCPEYATSYQDAMRAATGPTVKS